MLTFKGEGYKLNSNVLLMVLLIGLVVFRPSECSLAHRQVNFSTCHGHEVSTLAERAILNFVRLGPKQPGD